MGASTGRGAALVMAAAALAVGVAAGWVLARAAASASPAPPPGYVNPLADAKKGETLLLRQADGTLVQYRVAEADPFTVLLSVETTPPGAPLRTRSLRVGRSYFGALAVLEGDVEPGAVESAQRDFVLERADPAVLESAALGRSLRCWKVSGRHRVLGPVTFWVCDDLPVHGLARLDAARGAVYEVAGFGGGK